MRWHPMRRETYGADEFRDFVDGTPVHCGDVLELLAGDGKASLEVRYEVEWYRTDEGKSAKRAILCKLVGGYEFSRRTNPTMQFRWPGRGA